MRLNTIKKLILCICAIVLLLSACGFRGTGTGSGTSPEETAESQAPGPSPVLTPAHEGKWDESVSPEPNGDEPTGQPDGSATPEPGRDDGENHSDKADKVLKPLPPDGPENAGGNQQKEPAGENGAEQASGEESRPDTGAADPFSDPESALKGKIICIDPGHGKPGVSIPYEKIAPGSNETKPGYAYGTTGVSTKIPEYMLNMEVASRLRTALEARGCIVVMTRESNEENLGNIERARIGNEAGSDLVIRIHADGSDNPNVHGVSVLYPGSRYISDEMLLAKSKSAAQYIHDAVVQATGAKPRGIVRRDDLTGFNWTTRPVILIEMGFMTNPEEDRLLNSPEYQDRMVSGIVQGLIDYFSASRQ